MKKNSLVGVCIVRSDTPFPIIRTFAIRMYKISSTSTSSIYHVYYVGLFLNQFALCVVRCC